MRNLAAALFQLEKSRDMATIDQVLVERPLEVAALQGNSQAHRTA